MMWSDMEELGKMPDASPERVAALNDTRVRYERLFADAGLTPSDGGDWRTPRFGNVRTGSVSVTDALKTLQPEVGALSYRYLSGTTHSRPWRLAVDGVAERLPAEPEYGVVYMTLDWNQLCPAVLGVVDLYLTAAEHFAAWSGHSMDRRSPALLVAQRKLADLVSVCQTARLVAKPVRPDPVTVWGR